MLVKASIAGVIVTNTLFMLGMAFFLGGPEASRAEFNAAGARLQAGQLFLATVALIVLSTVPDASAGRGPEFTQHVSLWLALLLIVMYVLGLVFSLKTHREFFGAAAHQGDYHEPWPMASHWQRLSWSRCWLRSSAMCSSHRCRKRPRRWE